MNKKLVVLIIGLFLLFPGIVAATSSITDRVNRLEQRMDAWESKSTIQPTPTIQAVSLPNFMFSGHGDSSTSTMFIKSPATITCTTSGSIGMQIITIVLMDPTKYDVNDGRAGEVGGASWHIKDGSDTNTSTLYSKPGNYYLKVDVPAQVSWGINIK